MARVFDALAPVIAARVTDVVQPRRELGVNILDAGKATRLEERLAEVMDGFFDFSLFVAPVWGAGLRSEVVVSGQLEDPRVIPHELSIALEHDRLEIVIEKLSWRTPKRLERQDVSTKKALERLVECEAHEKSARERQTITKHDNLRSARPTRMEPKQPQSTWPCSPGKVSNRKKASRAPRGRTVLTNRRTCCGLPEKPRSRSISNRRVARRRGYCSSVSRTSGL
jgi:hypothetical protein